jgi:hypothetical protein
MPGRIAKADEALSDAASFLNHAFTGSHDPGGETSTDAKQVADA